MRIILLLLLLVCLNGLQAQEVLGSQTIKYNGVRIVLKLVKDSTDTIKFEMKIHNKRFSSIYFDPTYFIVSVLNENKKFKQIKGTTYIGTHPMKLQKLKRNEVFIYETEISEPTYYINIQGEIQFLTKKSINNLLNGSIEPSPKLNTGLLDTDATYIIFSGFSPEIKWEFRKSK